MPPESGARTAVRVPPSSASRSDDWGIRHAAITAIGDAEVRDQARSPRRRRSPGPSSDDRVSRCHRVVGRLEERYRLLELRVFRRRARGRPAALSRRIDRARRTLRRSSAKGNPCSGRAVRSRGCPRSRQWSRRRGRIRACDTTLDCSRHDPRTSRARGVRSRIGRRESSCPTAELESRNVGRSRRFDARHSASSERPQDSFRRGL